jgi:hypothetical protein
MILDDWLEIQVNPVEKEPGAVVEDSGQGIGFGNTLG